MVMNVPTATSKVLRHSGSAPLAAISVYRLRSRLISTGSKTEHLPFSNKEKCLVAVHPILRIHKPVLGDSP